MNKEILVLGAGGHASVLVDILKQNELIISALYCPEGKVVRSIISGISIYQDEDNILTRTTDEVILVNGLGSLPASSLRAKLYEKFTKKGYFFQQVISKKAIVSAYASLGKGVQVMPGAIIQPGAVIGDNSIINTGAIIEHDCIIGAHNHIAPGVTLSGHVKTGDYVHIGTGANVIQSIIIGTQAILGAGANVTKDIPSGVTVLGTKTKIINKRLDK